MYSPVKLAIKYLQYLLVASNGKGHGIHSPFVYDFVIHVLNDRRNYYAFDQIETCRKHLLKDDRVLTIEDFGAGSRTKKTNRRSVRTIAASSLKPKKYARLFFRMINYYRVNQVLELGTSLGITTAYMAAANSSGKVNTMEGSSAIASIARQNFEQLGIGNIQLTEGNFDEQLIPLLKQLPALDMVFVDGNHRFEPTLRYVKDLLPHLTEDSILIMDDIHWSREMEAAWKAVQELDNVTLTIDLFFIGLVFFRKENKEKQNFIIRF